MRTKRITARDARRFACGLGLSIVGAMFAVAIWLAFVPRGSDSTLPLAAVYVLGGAGLIYGMWVGEEVPRLRRHIAGILCVTALSAGALAGSSWLRTQRGAASLEQQVENPDAAR